MTESSEVVAELRARAIRLIARHGISTYPHGVNGEGVRVFNIDDIRFEVRSGRRLLVGFSGARYTEVMSKVLYDSDRLVKYQNVHVIRLEVLPRLRKEMVLDDLANI